MNDYATRDEFICPKCKGALFGGTYTGDKLFDDIIAQPYSESIVACPVCKITYDCIITIELIEFNSK